MNNAMRVQCTRRPMTAAASGEIIPLPQLYWIECESNEGVECRVMEYWRIEKLKRTETLLMTKLAVGNE